MHNLKALLGYCLLVSNRNGARVQSGLKTSTTILAAPAARRQPVLHTQVVNRAASEAGHRVLAINVDCVVIDTTAHAGWISRGVIALIICQYIRAAGVCRDEQRTLIYGIGIHGLHGGDGSHGFDLGITELLWCGVAEIVSEQTLIGDRVDGSEGDIGKTAAGQYAIDQTGIIIGDLVLLIGAAGAASAVPAIRRVAQAGSLFRHRVM